MAENVEEPEENVSGYELWDADTKNLITIAPTYETMLRFAVELIKANSDMSHDLLIGYSDIEGHYSLVSKIKVDYVGK